MQALLAALPEVEQDRRDNSPGIIGRLLPELLIHVFRVMDPRRRCDISVMHVCRLWRELILSTPEFWVSMVEGAFAQPIWKGPQTQENPEFFLTLIRRTAPRPYSLPLRARNVPLLTRFSQHDISRLVTLRINSCPDISILLSLRFPGLEQLVITDHHIAVIRGPGVEMGLSAPRIEQFPKLTELSVPAALFLPSLAVPSLRKLTVMGEIRTPDVFQRALRECKLLEHMTIYDCPLLPGLSHPPPTHVAVHMPNLSTLAAYGAHPPSGNPVLQLLTYPPSTRITFSLYGYRQSLRDIFPSRAGVHSSEMGPPVDRLICTGTIQLRRSRWEPFTTMILGVRGYVQGTETATVTVEPSPWGPSRSNTFCGPSFVIPDIVNVFSSSKGSLTHLEFGFDSPIAVTKNDWDLLLRSFPCVTVLSVRVNSCRNFLRALREVGVGAALESLSIRHSNGTGIYELFVTTMEGRAARGNPRLSRLAFYRSKRSIEDEVSATLSQARIARLQVVVDELLVDPASL